MHPAVGMIHVSLDPFTTSFGTVLQMAFTLSQTRRLPVGQLRFLGKYRHLLRQAIESAGHVQRSKRSWHLTVSCCPIGRRLSGVCVPCKDPLAGFASPLTSVI